MTHRTRRTGVGLLAAAAATSLVLPLLTTASAGATGGSRASIARPSVTSFPRNETVYTSGTMYNPPDIFNPNQSGSYATGTEGLIYETLFLYNPMNNHFIPWLAQSGSWTSPTTYTINLRHNVTWSDGKPLTSADVAYTIMLSKTDPGIYYSNLGADVASVATPDAYTAVVTFSTPAYEDWQTFLWQDPILDKAIWSKWSNNAINTGSNPNPVGSGPFTEVTNNAQEVAYQVNPNWWGSKDLGLHFKFKYLVDVVNGSNNTMLGEFVQDQLDLSNNFLPGISKLISSPASSGSLGGTGGYGLATYYPKAPYMLSANTAWLEPNLSKAPMSNLDFRKAIAYAVNPAQIVNVDYSGIVKAANPTGLMPNLDPYIDKGAVAKYGFSYNPTLAKQYLAKSGYKGQTITIEVPDGWTDWMAAIDILAQQLNAVGIKAQAITPSYTARTTDLTDGTYDLALDNNASISNDPYRYFQRVFELPINKQQTAQNNWERDNDPAAWALVQKLNSTPSTDTATVQGIYNQLETIELQTLPEIPLWYNGAWAQYNQTVWTNWPSSSNTADQYTPVMWRGWLGNMTTVIGLANLKPTPKS
jgi:peptide/nickel transport system substrate-binding protein